MGKVFSWILGIGTFVGAIFIWLSKRNEVSDLKTALQVQKVKEHVAKGEAELQERMEQTVNDAKIPQLEAEIIMLKAEAVRLATSADLSEKTDAEIAALFTSSGLSCLLVLGSVLARAHEIY